MTYPKPLTVLASGARTSSAQSDQFSTLSSGGMAIVIDVTAFASGTLTPALDLGLAIVEEAAGLQTTPYITFTTAIVATGTYLYLTHEGEPAAATPITEVWDRSIPRGDWFVTMTQTGGASITYSVGVRFFN